MLMLRNKNESIHITRDNEKVMDCGTAMQLNYWFAVSQSLCCSHKPLKFFITNIVYNYQSKYFSKVWSKNSGLLERLLPKLYHFAFWTPEEFNNICDFIKLGMVQSIRKLKMKYINNNVPMSIISILETHLPKYRKYQLLPIIRLDQI